MPKKTIPRRGHKRNKLRKNPTYSLGLPYIESITRTAGNLLVNDALDGATLEERVIVSSLIPMFLSVLRSIPKTNIDNATEKILDPKENPDA